MAKRGNKFNLVCPYCKKELNLELEDSEIEELNSGKTLHPLCPHCYKRFDYEETEPKNRSRKNSLDKNKISESDYNPRLHIKEYKRTCNECGKIWHSLISRESKIQGDLKSNKCDSLTAACGMCGGNWSALGASEQAKRNEHALSDEMTRLRKCPECGSSNYTEEVIIYEKK